jgi:hypothetical protein
MASTDLTMYRGENKTWTFTVTEGGSAVDLTGASIYFAAWVGIPASSIVADTTASISKSTVSGITITNGTGGVFDLAFVKATTNSLEPGGYLYGVEYIPNGQTEARVICTGVLTIYPDFVRAV